MHRVALLLLIGAVALTSADSSVTHCCSAADRHRVEKQWHAMFDGAPGKMKAGTARLLLQRVLQDYPEATALFKNVGVDDPKGGAFTAHSFRIYNALDMIINLLDDPEALGEALDHLADQHGARTGVKKAYFQSFGEALNRGLGKLIDNYDALSWKACMRGALSKIAGKLQA
jgi:hypothetical protein